MKKIIVSISLCAVVAGCALPPSKEELAGADYGSYPSNHEQTIKNYMQRVLKDAESARYQFLNSPKTGWNGFGGSKYGYVVCAYINAKNSYGGYVGNRMSYFMIRNDRVIDATHGDGEYREAMVEGQCSHFI